MHSSPLCASKWLSHSKTCCRFRQSLLPSSVCICAVLSISSSYRTANFGRVRYIFDDFVSNVLLYNCIAFGTIQCGYTVTLWLSSFARKIIFIYLVISMRRNYFIFVACLQHCTKVLCILP